MERIVRDIMSRELHAVRPDARAEDALDAIRELGINALPVLDDGGRPIGVTCLRDLVRSGRERRWSSPAVTVSVDAPIEDAARAMAESGYHQLVVVGADGRAAGMVSSLDLLRALVGASARPSGARPARDADDEDPGRRGGRR